MEGIKETNEVEFEEVKKVGFLGRFKSLFKKSPKMVTVQPGTKVETFEPVPVIPEKAEEVKPKRFASLFKGIKKEISKPVTFEPVKLKPPKPLFKETKKGMPETVSKPLETTSAEKEVTPMVRILPKEEKQPVAGEKGLVEVAKPVKLEKVVLGFDEEKEIVKLEEKLRRMRLSLEKKLKEEWDSLDKRKEAIEQLDATFKKYQLQREEALNRREAQLKVKEKQLGTITSSHLIGREEELNKREMELITKEREMRQKIDEEMKKLVEKEREIIVKEKELDSAARKHQLDREEELNKKEMELLEREKMLGVGLDEDVKKLLIVMDELLGKLPKDVIDEFVRSEDYKLYEKVLDRYGV